MSARHHISGRIGRTLADESGATLVELTLVLPLFLLIFLGIIDFGRLGFDVVTAEKAMQRAARIATVRPSVCAGLPDTTQRDGNNTTVPAPRFGTACNSGSQICQVEATISCTLQTGISAGNATATEIWNSINELMPANASPANVRITYTDSGRTGSPYYDAAGNLRLGFLGGPYVPVVTAEVIGPLQFNFVTPIGGLARLGGASSATFNQTIDFPSLSVSLPGEDLANGENG